ncbi:hypothetical protein J437_LFUL013216 [Ladona fulva]|uniref:Uncharacterized protein n=1 Tax=Ladona fulva TaxID=123851 RepID=A0A8K0KQP8_LADFU|nr:hypothetical protein J437_LFUL013216 [Ladona fulva]
MLIKLKKGDENLIICGDMNAVVGIGWEGDIVGAYGLGKRNERGGKLVEFCGNKKLWVANTWFKHHERRRYTWSSRRYHINRNIRLTSLRSIPQSVQTKEASNIT